MAQMIFVNLPVKDLDRAKAFYEGLGYSINPQFTDDNASMVQISDLISVMLLTEPYFKTFTPKEVADATRTTEVLLALSADSREDVDRLIDKAIAGGGREPRAVQDEGFMYGRAFEDPDGHIWEVAWMDMAAVEAQQASATSA